MTKIFHFTFKPRPSKVKHQSHQNKTQSLKTSQVYLGTKGKLCWGHPLSWTFSSAQELGTCKVLGSTPATNQHQTQPSLLSFINSKNNYHLSSKVPDIYFCTCIQRIENICRLCKKKFLLQKGRQERRQTSVQWR